MNKALIVDASEPDRRLMAGLPVKHGYETTAVDIIQRPAIDKELIETVGKCAKPESVVIQLKKVMLWVYFMMKVLKECG